MNQESTSLNVGLARAVAVMGLAVAAVFLQRELAILEPSRFLLLYPVVAYGAYLGRFYGILALAASSLLAEVYILDGRLLIPSTWTQDLLQLVFFVLINVGYILLIDGLKRNRQRADQARHAREELTGLVSHEVRNALTAATLTLSSLRALSPADAALRRVETAVWRAQRILNDVLDASYLRHREPALARRRVELNALFLSLREQIAPLFEDAGIELVVEAESARLEGEWDPQRLEQIFLNLLTNAMKYGRGLPVRVTIFRRQRDACVKVCDRGVGIEPEAQAHVFDAFERASSAQRKQGFGLGLYIAARLTRAHGGRIELESRPGAGTCMTVCLPLPDVEAAPDVGSAEGENRE